MGISTPKQHRSWHRVPHLHIEQAVSQHVRRQTTMESEQLLTNSGTHQMISMLPVKGNHASNQASALPLHRTRPVGCQSIHGSKSKVGPNPQTFRRVRSPRWKEVWARTQKNHNLLDEVYGWETSLVDFPAATFDFRRVMVINHQRGGHGDLTVT